MKKLLLAGLAALTIATPVLADPHWGRGDRGGWRGDRGWHDGGGRYRGGPAYGRGWGGPRYGYGYAPRYGYGYGARYAPGYRHYGYGGPSRYWYRGDYLPSAYWGPSRFLDPYRYGLYAPPRGYAWMHVGNDVYLTALATGLIVEVLRDSYD